MNNPKLYAPCFWAMARSKRSLPTSSIFEKLNSNQKPNPPAMPKLPECDRCQLYARNPHLVCAVHPAGPTADTCLDFHKDPNAAPDELWEPEGASYYNGELILQPRQRWTTAEKLELLDTHPLFTGRCPQCSHPFPQSKTPPMHWDCAECGWMDDSV
jgi:hypothetical protein